MNRTTTRQQPIRPTASRSPLRPALTRPRDCVLGGVCVALARHLGCSVAVVRLLFLTLIFASGAGVLLYLWLWALTPVEALTGADGTHGDAVHRLVPVAWLLFALSAVLAIAVLTFGALFDARSTFALAPGVIVMVLCAVGSVAWDQLIDVPSAKQPKRSRIRIAAGCVLLAVAALEPFAWSGLGGLFAWPLFTLTVLAGAAVLLGSWSLRLWRELIAERTNRVREEQRAEIAAHLHDSVLQTLALIQNRAGASSEVARIARAQERELRDWLYAGSAPPDSDLATELRDFAAALELDYAVRIEVVTVGEPVERASGELAAAAREAMLNAARHAGGDVSVYLETTATAVDVFVRDRGPGFDPADVPQGRLGVRESILGRMRRAGGSARVGRVGEGTGTEVRLQLDRQTATDRDPGTTATEGDPR